MTQSRSRSHAVCLGALGLLLLLICLYWNRIALGGPLGQAPGWVRNLTLPIDGLARLAGCPIGKTTDESGQGLRIEQLVESWTLAFAVFLLAAWWALRTQKPGPYSLDVILAFSILFRIVLIASPPLLETDPQRYLWDGAVQAAGLNPYGHAPLETLRQWPQGGGPDSPGIDGSLKRRAALSRQPEIQRHFLRINHPDIPTIYPPAAQQVFSLAARLAPGNVYVLKSLIVCFDLGIILILGALLVRLGQPRHRILLYGWCPLVLKEYANTGHYDPVASLLLLTSLYCVLRYRRVLAGVLAGLAVSAKVYPVVAVAVLCRRFGRTGLLVCVLAGGIMHLPYIDAGLPGLAGLGAYSTTWFGNASLFTLVRAGLAPLDDLGWSVPVPLALSGVLPSSPAALPLDGAMGARIVLAVLLLWGIICIFRMDESRDVQVLRKAGLAVALLFIVSPVQQPWYLGWVLPFAVLSGEVSWFILSGTMVTYYCFFSTRTYVRMTPQGLPLDLRWIEYLPFYGLWVLENWRSERQEDRGGQGQAEAGQDGSGADTPGKRSSGGDRSAS